MLSAHYHLRKCSLSDTAIWHTAQVTVLAWDKTFATQLTGRHYESDNE